jgi:cytochrome c biogenesis protein CcmG/thiol:disulfide interchange protein DsbE
MRTTAMAFSILIFLSSGLPAEDKRLWAKSVLNEKAPALEVEKWLTAEPDTKGKFVLIDFWATWCGPCRTAIPELNAFQKKFADRLVVIGVSNEAEEKVLGMESPKVEYASAIDTQSRTKKALEVKGIPHVIVIDPDGVVRWEGFPLLSGHELTEAVLEGLFEEYGGGDAAKE